jgi:outer membrane protein assembly factor BamE (lipoprotein component of BamABCDE complex)
MLHDRSSWFTQAFTNCNANLPSGGRTGKESPLANPSIKRNARGAAVAAALVASFVLPSCQQISSPSQVITNGFVADEQTLALAPVGSSREQVLLALGSPSASATFGNEVFYYISQKRERAVAFMKSTLVSQTVLAVYFDKDGNVAKLSNYTLKDGKVFDMISRTTPTGGQEITFLQRMLGAGSSGAAGRAAVQDFFGGTNTKNMY